MFVTWILSMCIANTSTTALMIPIVISVLDQLHESENKASGYENTAFDAKESDQEKESIKDEKIPDETIVDSEEEETTIGNVEIEVESTQSEEDEEPGAFRRTALDIGLLLCVPFAASIGGTGTFTGTDLNLYLAGFYQDYYRNYTYGPGDGYQVR